MANTSFNATQITPPRVPIIDDRTGLVSREWYRYFYSLYAFTGNGTGILPIVSGGTGLDTIPTDGQLLIGDTASSGYKLHVIDTGAGIAITNGAGTILIANTGVLSNIAGSGIGVSSATGNVTLANTGVLSFSGGSTGLLPSSATTGAVSLSGTLGVGYGGTGQTTYTNGQLLIGNTTGNTLTKTTLTAGSGVSISNGAGSITISATGSGGTVTAVTGTAPVVSSGGTTPAISMPKATTSVDGYLSSTDWTAFNNKGSGTVTSVAALTLGTTGTDLSSTVATGTTTPVITLNVPTASASNRGALSSADWTTFNNKGSGTVTSVGGTGTVNGITLTGTVTSSGNLTLGGTLSGVSLTTQVSGTLPVANGGTGITTLTAGLIPYGNGTSAFASTGNLRFDTTNQAVSINAGASPSGIIHAYSNSSTYSSGYFQNPTGDQTATTVILKSGRADTFYHMQFYNSSTTECWRVEANGNTKNTNNSYGALSDVKIKENIVDATPKLADLMKVKVKNYNLIGDTNKQIGVVAQELEDIFPGMVDETKDRDADGVFLGTITKGVKYSVFVPILIKALQELKAEFDAYKAQHP